jgi:EAL domain-containing protein (putative c-di-GMP-specific phosphodiesterase class I)
MMAPVKGSQTPASCPKATGFPADRIILEITEHDFMESYDDLLRTIVSLRARGVKIAVDDAGSGYASMRHILNVYIRSTLASRTTSTVME